MSGFLRHIAALLLFGTHGVGIAAGTSPAETLHCNSPATTLSLPGDGSPLGVLVDNDALWLQWQDTGQETSTDSVDALYLPQPLRLGWHWLPVRDTHEIVIHRVETNHARGQIIATLHCAPGDALQSRLLWIKKASEAGAHLDVPTDANGLAQELATIDALERESIDATTRAIALHYRAEALIANDRSADAGDAFATAEAAWHALDDRARALAAHLGRVEALKATAAYQAVLDQTPAISTLHGEQNYFSVRLENPRCLSLQAIGRLDEASECFDWVLANYKNLDERSEYVVAMQPYANLQRERGNFDRAEQLGVQGIEIASGASAPMVRGRMQLMLADISRRRGDVTGSLARARLAMDEFEHAGAGASDWQASTSLSVAILYNQLGADDEAAAALNDAVRRISARDAPSRMALAMSVFADIETATGHPDSALWWRRAVEDTYARLNMPPALNAARLQRLQLLEEQGDIDTVLRELAAHPQGDTPGAVSWLLLDAAVALKQNRLGDASATLGRLKQKPLSLRDQIRLSHLQASYREGNADTVGAQQELQTSALRIQTLASQAHSQVLRDVIARQVLPLRRSGLRLLLDSSGTSSAAIAEAAWSWLGLTTEPSSPNSLPPGKKTAELFDRAVAQELLAIPGKAKSAVETAAQRELLALLTQAEAGRHDTNSTLQLIPLSAMQRSLAGDAALIAYLDGENRGALLWLTRDHAAIVDAATPERLRAAIAIQRELLASPRSSPADLAAATATLSTQLLGSLPAAPAPARLYVLADDLLDGIAWGTLIWPGQSAPLVETTSTSLLRLESGSVSALPANAPLHVLVAAQQQSTNAALPELSGAAAEPALIQRAVADRAISVTQDADRASVLAALDDNGAWVHIAAHGFAQPQRIGYAGLWLQAKPDDATTPVLSWLEILDRGARAGLVVLNACQTGDSGPAVNGNLSFAAAVSRAGANQVVAAMWPVSDAASALWVPEFYAAVSVDPQHDAARALRAAQLRLRSSRAFAHPFFWAGMQAQSRLRIEL